MRWLSAKSGVRLPHIYNIVLLCLSENAEGKYISPFHDIPMYADEGQVTSFYWNDNERATVWTAVHHFEQLCRIPTSESEFQKYFWNNRAAPLTLTRCSRLVCHRTTSSHELLQWHILYCICFWRNRELSVWLICLPVAILEVLLLRRRVAVKQGVCSDGVGQATKVAQYCIRPSKTC